ncbi:MAG: extracellular solute-binding protein [Deltaproteobacteria bacterium]|nr:extracellular solute-binding protein [Deltaproteobacteria bacterium]
MTKKFFILAALVVVIGMALAGCGAKEVTLDVYAGEGMRKPMLEIKESYEELHPNVTINYNFAASQTLEATMRTLQQGDLYVSGATDVQRMAEDNLIIESYPIASLTPAILVRSGDNTVASWDDLAKEGVRVVIMNPDLGSAGRAASKVIGNSPLDEQIRANITALTANGSETLQMLINNQADAAIIWGGLAKTNPALAAIEIPEELNTILDIWAGIPTYTTVESDAIAFAEYIVGAEGLQAYENAGFSISEK